jgi:hypothetical protein
MPTTMKLIAKTTLGSAAANIEFTSIPGTYTDLLVVLSTRSSRASTNDNIKVRFNGASTDSNFTWRNLYGDGTTAISGTGSSFGFVSDCNAANNTSNTFTSVEVYIPNYAGSTNKSFSVTQAHEQNGTTAYTGVNAGLWSQTSAITSMNFLLTTGPNFVTNSSAFLYGITKS